MSHLDDDTIALAAIGEQLEPAQLDHLRACAICRAEVDSLTRVVTVARSTTAADTLTAPPADVWARIAAETGIDGALPASLDARRSGRAEAARVEGGPAETDGATDVAPGRTGLGVDGGARRGPADRWGHAGGSRTGLLVAACATGLVLGVGATLLVQAVGDQDPSVLAAASLAPLPDKSGSGEAEVVDTASGRELEVSLDAELPEDAFLQVWLLSPDASRMVPVGVISGSTGHWTLPPDVVLADYPVVDVSIEPYDGNPAHSSDSIVRGSLDLSSAVSGEA